MTSISDIMVEFFQIDSDHEKYYIHTTIIQFVCILESQVVEWNTPVEWREISPKQSVGKCKQLNF